MKRLLRTNAENADFVNLVAKLNQELAILDGEEYAFYSQFNKLDSIKHVVLAYMGEEAIACGAIKAYDANTMEVKRMYTNETIRGKGIATMVLKELEQWAIDLGYEKCILETGTNQPDAIRLYEKNGYQLIPNYGQYEGKQASKCFEKTLKSK